MVEQTTGSGEARFRIMRRYNGSQLFLERSDDNGRTWQVVPGISLPSYVGYPSYTDNYAVYLDLPPLSSLTGKGDKQTLQPVQEGPANVLRGRVAGVDGKTSRGRSNSIDLYRRRYPVPNWRAG